ncbi:MAG: NapC/NirT family cytochrome c [Gammaproteobacteria bacterium]|jgi:nitrate/TMAO reductase-like tetraheme cytochrome c subunit|nr:NapC/NirT family cytochrome c [Gammaproteobacteria bacterium]
MFDLYRQLLTRKIILGTTVGAALFFMVVGVIFWGGFNTGMEVTNTLDFCISCHEMENNVYQEYKKTIHYTNRSGVRATCSDCHVPDPWGHKVARKIQASNEVLHKIMGTIDTPEKFDENRLRLAKNVWRAMKETDSRECRNCHNFDTMNPGSQKDRSQKQHLNAMQAGNTCIDCHKGIAHKKVHDQLTDEEIDALEKPRADHIRPIAPQWQALLTNEVAAAPVATPAVDVQAAMPAAVTAAEPAPVAAATKTETAPAATPAAPVTTEKAAPAKAAGGAGWSTIPARQITVFYPGQTSMEWVLGRTHGGARAFKSGDRCTECHDKETGDMGHKIVTGLKEGVEPTPIPGKRGSIPVQVQAANDGKNLLLRFQWPDGDHAAAPFAKDGKMDPANKVKLAIMLATDDVEYADRTGCWGTCHADSRTMPFAPDQSAIAGTSLQYAGQGVTKYIGASRTEIELKVDPLGGWNKLKSDDEIKAELGAGHYMDLMRYKMGEKVSENGHVLKERVSNDGGAVEFNATLNGGTWTVELKRPLKTGKPGDINLESGKVYNLGFAIHDDYSNARFHHVSLGYKLGINNAESDLNAAKK